MSAPEVNTEISLANIDNQNKQPNMSKELSSPTNLSKSSPKNENIK